MRGRRRREGENGERGCEDGRQGRTLTGHDELPFGCGSASGRSECRTSSGRPPQMGVELPDGPAADPIVVFVRCPQAAVRWPLAIIHCPLAAAAGGSQRLGGKPDQIRQRLGTDSTTIRQQLCRTSASTRQRVGRAAADAGTPTAASPTSGTSDNPHRISVYRSRRCGP